MRTQNQRIQQLEADLQLAESNYREAEQELSLVKDELETNKTINKDL